MEWARTLCDISFAEALDKYLMHHSLALQEAGGGATFAARNVFHFPIFIYLYFSSFSDHGTARLPFWENKKKKQTGNWIMLPRSKHSTNNNTNKSKKRLHTEEEKHPKSIQFCFSLIFLRSGSLLLFSFWYNKKQWRNGNAASFTASITRKYV